MTPLEIALGITTLVCALGLVIAVYFLDKVSRNLYYTRQKLNNLLNRRIHDNT